MKARVDQDLCIGCGLCTTLCPDVFELNGEGKAEAVGEGEFQDAVDNCPVTAISAEETAEEAEAPAEETVEEVTEEAPAGRYVCGVCGYVYDPAEHDGVAFEDLPEDWVCPLCAVGKDMFNPE